jgi:hypothetical protein
VAKKCDSQTAGEDHERVLACMYGSNLQNLITICSIRNKINPIDNSKSARVTTNKQETNSVAFSPQVNYTD